MLMKSITINKDSLDKDCSKYIHIQHYVAYNGKIIWPVTRTGEEVTDDNPV